jgi:SSS family solute:Na+ symporter
VFVSAIDLAIVGAYLIGMLSLGYYLYRKAPTHEQYHVAGRSMTTPILVCSLASTYYGLDVLFGTSEVGYNEGVVAFFGYSQMSIAIYVFAGLYLAKRLRNANFTSLPEILERHYGRSAGIVGAAASIVYSVPALGLFALGRICQVIFGMDPMFGALILGLVALAYTMLGGLWAVAITDTIQFVLMCVTLAIAIPLLMLEVGGFDAVAASAPETYFDWLGGMPIWLLIAYAATGVSILVDPGFYQRVFAAVDFKAARNAMLISVVVWGAYDWLVTAGGMLAAAGVASGHLPADMHTNDALLMAVTMALPVGLVGIFLAGVLATGMSTIDSYTLVAGGNMAYDIYRPLARPNATDAELVRATKIGVVLAWVAGYALAFMFERLMALWVFVATTLTSTVLVPIFIALYSNMKKTTMAGLMSCLAGLASVIGYYVLVQRLGAYDDVYGTFIWTVEIGSSSVALWQEYALFFSLPISVAGFLVGNRIGIPHDPLPARVVR